MAVLYGLKEVVGSYALAVGRYYGAGSQLVLATNYRPIHLVRDGRTVFFASQLDYVYESPERLGLPSFTVPPYTLVSFHTSPSNDEWAPTYTSLRTTNPRTPRALVVCSGGLDSTVAATQMREDGYEVTLLHYSYGCRAEQRERAAVEQVAAALGADVLHVDLRHLFTQVIGGSPLTNTSDAIAGGEAGAEYAHEWVPARNLIMLSIAIDIAEAHDYTCVVLGNNLEEAGAYPDNEQEFIRLLNQVVPYAVADGKELSLSMPVGTLVKHEIVALGHKLGAPVALSWSCYNAGTVHCGECGPCYMRRHAHTMAGLVDPTEYAT
jgi:7-cyano-7-deazaguanine synthase